jgi:hypothetical protein
MITLTTKFSSSSLLPHFQSYAPQLIPIENTGTLKAIDNSFFNSSCISGVKSFCVIFNVRSNLVCLMGLYKSGVLEEVVGGEVGAGEVEVCAGEGEVGAGEVGVGEGEVGVGEGEVGVG